MKKEKGQSPKDNTTSPKNENLISNASVMAEKDEVKKAEERLINAKKPSK